MEEKVYPEVQVSELRDVVGARVSDPNTVEVEPSRVAASAGGDDRLGEGRDVDPCVALAREVERAPLHLGKERRVAREKCLGEDNVLRRHRRVGGEAWRASPGVTIRGGAVREIAHCAVVAKAVSNARRKLDEQNVGVVVLGVRVGEQRLTVAGEEQRAVLAKHSGEGRCAGSSVHPPDNRISRWRVG